MSEQDKLNDYDSEPVVFCASCLSLKIKHDEDLGFDYCGKCGCTEVREASPEEWDKLYQKKYGKKFIDGTNDIRKSPIFQLPLSKLMHKVSDSPKWDIIIREMYGCLPRGLGKADSIVVFFDKLIKDNKLDQLRMLLFKMKL